MKKHILIAASLLISATILKAQDASVSSLVTARFSKHFEGASNVRWESLKNQVLMVRFNYDNGHWLAYFDNQGGKLIASARSIPSISQLPFAVKGAVAKSQERLQRKYGELAPGRIYEVMSEGSTLYYIALQNDFISILVSADIAGNSSVHRKDPLGTQPASMIKPLIAQKSKN